MLLAESGRAMGGTERVVWELATRLPRERFEVTVWLPGVPGLVDERSAQAAQETQGRGGDRAGRHGLQQPCVTTVVPRQGDRHPEREEVRHRDRDKQSRRRVTQPAPLCGRHEQFGE